MPEEATAVTDASSALPLTPPSLTRTGIASPEARRDAKLLRRARAGTALVLPILLATEPESTFPEPAAPAVPLGVLLAGILLLVNLLDPSVQPNAPLYLMRRRAVIEIFLDAMVMLTVVWLVALDPSSSLWVLLLLPVLEAALRFQIRGALVTTIGVTALYIARDFWVASAHDGISVDASNIVGRTGVLAVVGLAAGSLAARLAREAHRHAEVRLEAERRTEILAIVADASAQMTSLDLGHVRRVVHEALNRLGVVGRIVPPTHRVDHDIEVIFDIATNDSHRGGIVVRRPVPVPVIGAIELLANQAGIVVELAETFAEAERLRKRLEHQAYHDPLTGLPNRAAFDEDLRKQAERRGPPGDGMAVLFIDLDGFKQVNDRLGHEAGDVLLAATARRLEECVRPGDSVARLGGDEFTVLLTGVPDVESALIVADRVLETLDQPFAVPGGRVRVSGSIGVAFAAAELFDADELVRRADQAMYQAKRGGRGRIVVYDPAAVSKA